MSTTTEPTVELPAIDGGSSTTDKPAGSGPGAGGGEAAGGGKLASWRPTAFISRTLGITQGQAATLVVALIVAGVLTAAGLPPVLRHTPASSESAFDATSGGTAPPSAPAAGGGDVAVDAGDAPAAPVQPAPFSGSGSSGRGSPSFGTGGSSSGGSSTGGGSPAPFTPTEPEDTGSSGPFVPPGSTALFAPVAAPGAPHGLAVDRDGTVYVATNNGTSQGEPGPSQIQTFEPDGTPGRAFTISGQPDGHELGLTGLALDGEGGIIALDAATARVLRVARSSGTQSVLAELIDLPACQLVVAAESGCEPGVQDDAPLPIAAAFDSRGRLFVADAGQGLVWQVPAGGGDPTLWFSSRDLSAPDSLSGLTIDGSGNVLLVSPQTLNPASPAGGAVYRIPMDAAGKAGEAAVVATFAPGEGPAGIVARTDGSMMVALRDAGAIVLVGADGAEVERVTGEDGVALASPTGLAFHGSTLLATNQSPDDPAGWAVLAVGLG